MNELLSKTFTELTAPEPLEVYDLGETPLTFRQLSGLFAAINYRFENLLPTITHTDRKPFELAKALCFAGDMDGETLAYGIVGRLWEMGIRRDNAPEGRI